MTTITSASTSTSTQITFTTTSNTAPSATLAPQYASTPTNKYDPNKQNHLLTNKQKAYTMC